MGEVLEVGFFWGTAPRSERGRAAGFRLVIAAHEDTTSCYSTAVLGPRTTASKAACTAGNVTPACAMSIEYLTAESIGDFSSGLCG